jgi:hypothetical protein
LGSAEKICSCRTTPPTDEQPQPFYPTALNHVNRPPTRQFCRSHKNGPANLAAKFTGPIEGGNFSSARDR